MSDQPALVIHASSKRVVSNGDDSSIVFDVGPADWARFIASGMHKPGNPLLLSIRPMQQQMEWTPPEEQGHSTGNGHKRGCFFNEALNGYQCKEQPTQLLETPCSHYVNPDDDGSVASEADKAVLSEPTCGLQDGIWYCSDLPGVRLDSACEHMMIDQPKRTWYGRRIINGVVVEGRNPCPNVQCGRRAPKDGETHECRAPRSYVSDDGEGAGTRDDEPEGATA